MKPRHSARAVEAASSGLVFGALATLFVDETSIQDGLVLALLFATLMLAGGATRAWYERLGHAAPPRALSREQREALETTLLTEGRPAAISELRSWTGLSEAEATVDINAAFPDDVSGR